MKKIVLCSRPNGCCPEVTVLDKENILIDDDWGNQIRITREDLDELVERYDRGEFN